jgi:hypothetical protein
VQDRLTQLGVELLKSRADQALDTIWGRRFKAHIPASLVEGFSHMFHTMRGGEHVVTEPCPERFTVSDGGFAKS